MATVTAIEYSGLIWCPTVSTGAFVARRNGKVFITGNSGFPKSLDVGKAIDKAAGVEFDAVPATGVGFMNAEGAGGYNVTKNTLVRKGESTEAARQWQGWGTALKPALEPITVARKPLVGTVAANVLAHGTGALNIDGCRVETDDDYAYPNGAGGSSFTVGGGVDGSRTDTPSMHPLGRWPANLLHDGSDEVLAAFPVTGPSNVRRPTGGAIYGGNSLNSTVTSDTTVRGVSDNGGSAARFFYCAKASKSDRGDGNIHPTVKPTDLMRYLCRLVTPPGGVVLDPFMGSGSTGKGAVLEGFKFIGIDRDDWLDVAGRRIATAKWGPWVFGGAA